MKRRVALPIAVVASALLSSAAMSAEPRAVIELFTSQGCSSCPPADKLAGELAQDPSLLVMSLPIDYWDYLGWKDTLANPGHTNRQRAYSQGARRPRGLHAASRRQRDGAGARQRSLRDRERRSSSTAKHAGTLSLPVAVSVANDQISVNVPADKGKVTKGEIWLCPITKNVPVTVGKGENSGHTITYHNVVRKWIKLGEWTGAARSFTLPVHELGDDEAEQVAVIIQAGSKEAPGAMLGANVAALK